MDWQEIEKKLNKIYDSQVTGERIEGQFLDVKRCPKKIKQLIQLCRHYSVCFANADGGSLVLGVEDKILGPKAFTGCPDFETWKIVKSVREGTKPSVTIEVIYHDYKGVNLIEMKVQQGPYEAGHALTDGSQTKRIGADCVPIYPTSITPKFIHAERLDYSRAIIDDVEFDDLSKNEIKTIRELIKISETSTDFLRLDDMELLKTLGMINQTKTGEVKTTVAGLLFAGDPTIIKNFLPYSEIVFVSYDEHGKEEYEKRYESGLLSMIWDFQELYNKTFNPVYHVDTGLVEIKIPKMPQPVLREALLNAVTHRDYNLQSSIFFRNYPDRVELTNPGDFISDIAPSNILRHDPAWRNRLIAEIFQRMGLVRRSGLGVRRMYRYLMNQGKEPPIYSEEGSEIRLTIYDRVDDDIAKYLNKNESLPLDEMIIISKIKSVGKIKTEEAAIIMQRPIQEAKTVLMRMCNKGKLDRHGDGRGTYYRFSPLIYESLGDSVGYFRNGDIEKRRQKEMIIQFLKDRVRIKNDQVQNLLKMDRDHAYLILKELKDNNDIKLVGSGRATKSRMEIF